ncbi:Uu.00g134320.m01.CDS01 [Anthostomella pinea]|uniref:Uu.00g134320.m01.CDS01 n=1 Tax=Anthostomella pinea TaxID=933095 RepID=A0AAI8VNX0_9PEZI|nr:Uu.00g134320.m01.CDS01 [Anthostomella pinea]
MSCQQAFRLRERNINSRLAPFFDDFTTTMPFFKKEEDDKLDVASIPTIPSIQKEEDDKLDLASIPRFEQANEVLAGTPEAPEVDVGSADFSRRRCYVLVAASSLGPPSLVSEPL